MKLIRQQLRAPRSDDTLGRGMDIALTVGLFFGIGFFVDRWLGTTPIFMIGLTLLAVVGFFVSMKCRYTAEMERLEAERAARAQAGGAAR
jgi:F0F1-type ATP synthase assembly protein I